MVYRGCRQRIERGHMKSSGETTEQSVGPGFKGEGGLWFQLESGCEQMRTFPYMFLMLPH